MLNLALIVQYDIVQCSVIKSMNVKQNKKKKENESEYISIILESQSSFFALFTCKLIDFNGNNKISCDCYFYILCSWL